MLAVNGTLTILLSNGSLNQLLLKLCLQVLSNVESTNFSRSSTHLCIPLFKIMPWFFVLVHFYHVISSIMETFITTKWLEELQYVAKSQWFRSIKSVSNHNKHFEIRSTLYIKINIKLPCWRYVTTIDWMRNDRECI